MHFYLLTLLMTLLSPAEEIIETGKFLDKHRLCPATSGNISVRLDPDNIAITSSGKHKGHLACDDILVVDLEGKPQNSSSRPSAETLLHTIVYALFENVGAVIHTHTTNGVVLSRLLRSSLITTGYEMHKAFSGMTTHESELTIPIFENSQDMGALSQQVKAYLQKNSEVYGFLLRGHGLYTWGKNMEEARLRVEAFEHLFDCELKMRALHANH